MAPQYADPTGSLDLANLRGTRRAELEQRVSAGDPRAAQLLSFLTGAENADPYTGQAAHTRQSKFEDVLDFLRPDVSQRRNEEQRLKVELAGEPARQAGMYDVAQQKIASQGLVDAAHARPVAGGGTRSGGGAQLASGLMERVAGGANALDSLNRLRAMRPGVTIGPAAGRTQTFLQQVPLLPSSKEFAGFKAESDALTNATIKAITGAQMSEPEAQRIKGQIPGVNDKDEVWSAKADALERVTRGLNVRIGLLQRGVPPELLDRVNVEDLADINPDEIQ